MKRIFLNCILVFFFIPMINAQVIQGTSNTGNGGSSGDIMFGAKAGFGLSTFSGRDYIDITPTPGFFVGGLVEIPAFLENFYLQPELLVQLQGADIGSGNLNLVYVHLPVMAKYHITEKIAVEFGPQVGLLIADNWDEDVSIIDTNKLHFGLNLGGGYRMNENFYFQARFSPGLTSVIEQTKTRNFAFQIGASYFF